MAENKKNPLGVLLTFASFLRAKDFDLYFWVTFCFDRIREPFEFLKLKLIRFDTCEKHSKHFLIIFKLINYSNSEPNP